MHLLYPSNYPIIKRAAVSAQPFPHVRSVRQQIRFQQSRPSGMHRNQESFKNEEELKL